MLNVLALCHTCRVDKKDNLATGGYSETGFEYEYQASSPDEKALVEACRRSAHLLVIRFTINMHCNMYSIARIIQPSQIRTTRIIRTIVLYTVRHHSQSEGKNRIR